MSPTPTTIDREAARLFTPAPGMAVFDMHGKRARIAEAAWAGRALMHLAADSLPSDVLIASAVDTDDPATIGVMLAQVEAASSCSVELWHCPDDPPEESSVVFIRALGFATWKGPTHGAALVAAMRAIKGAK